MRLLFAVLGLNALGITFLRNILQSDTSPASQESGDTLLLYLPNSVDPILEQLQKQSFTSRQEKAKAIKAALTDATAEWHAPAHALLKPFGVSTKSYWVANIILVRGSSPLIEDVIHNFNPSIKILKNFAVNLLPAIDGKFIGKSSGPEWGVSQIRAPEAWDRGVIGNNCIVGSIDTGVNAEHEALRDNFFGLDGWHDPAGIPEPWDAHGHGTHTMGTISGTKGIGVAPGATWTSCRGCGVANCLAWELIECGQWYACIPPDCGTFARVISNSWGGGGGSDFYDGVLKVWHACEIIAVFAIGNSGPDCSSAGSPGDRPLVISVGATDINDNITDFSSLGPIVNPAGTDNLAPQIVAPGLNIISAWNLVNNGYQSMSGTSMATPHVAGVVALLISKDSTLKFDQIVKLLYPFANRTLAKTGLNCGNVADDHYPNFEYGHGRLDAMAALNQITSGT